MERIRLENLLPRVFADTGVPPSMVWLERELVFERGCRVIVAADSGRGKSSMVSFICGERTDYQGQIFFDRRDVRTLGVKEWCDVRRHHIAVLPQEMRLFPELSAIDNVLVKNRLTDRYATQEIRDMLGSLGLDDRADTPVGKLSIGQQQRVAIVRAICQPFDFIILDEPVSHLDEENNRRAAAMIEHAASEQGAGIITTSVGNPLAIDALTTLTL